MTDQTTNQRQRIADNLRRILSEKGWTQAKLYREIWNQGYEISQSKIEKIFRAKHVTNRNTLMMLSIVLDVDVEDITGEVK